LILGGGGISFLTTTGAGSYPWSLS
jgi:hypothetical protein